MASLLISLFFHLPLLTKGSGLQDPPSGLLITGGYNAKNLVEFWAPPPHSVQCSFPELPKGMDHHSIDSAQGQLVTCLDDQCDLFDGKGLTPLSKTLHTRNAH